MKTKSCISTRKSAFTLLLACVMIFSLAMILPKSGGRTNDVSAAVTKTNVEYSVKTCTEAGVNQLSYFLKDNSGAGYRWAPLATTLEMQEHDGITAPTMSINGGRQNFNTNCIKFTTPIEASQVTGSFLSVKLYAHFSGNGTTYPTSRDTGGRPRGVGLFPLDSNGAEGGIIIPSNITQDGWVNLFVDPSLLVSQNGKIEGIQIASTMREIGSDDLFYVSSISAFLSISDITLYPTNQQGSDIEILPFMETQTSLSYFGKDGDGNPYQWALSTHVDSPFVVEEHDSVSAPTIYFHTPNFITYSKSNYIGVYDSEDTFDADTQYVSVRLYAHLSSDGSYATTDGGGGPRGVRLFALDSDGSDGGALIPSNIAQDEWVDLKLFGADAEALLSENGKLEGVQVASCTRWLGNDTDFYQGTVAYLSISDISIMDKENQAPLTLNALNYAKYGDTASLSVSGGSGSGAVTYVVTGGTGSAVITNNQIKYTGIGTVIIKAVKAGDGSYNQAESATVTVNVSESESNSSLLSAELVDGGENLQVGLTGSAFEACQYQYWIRVGIVTDSNISNDVRLQYIWIMQKGYSDAATTIKIPTDGQFVDEFGNYCVSVRIKKDDKFVGEITRSFSAEDIGSTKLASVMVNGIEKADGIYAVNLDETTSVSIKAEGEFTETKLYNGEEVKATSNNGEMAWDVTELSAGEYKLKVAASGASGIIEKMISVYLYSSYDQTVMPVINGINVQREGNIAEITVNASLNSSLALAAGQYDYAISLNGSTYKNTTGIFADIDLVGYGIHEIFATVARSGMAADDSYLYYYNYSRAVAPTVTLASDTILGTAVTGQSVILTAGDFVIGEESASYKFVRYDASGWTTVRNYAVDNTFTWIPTKAGNYQFMVFAKGETSGSYEATASVSVIVTGETLSGTLTVSTLDYLTKAVTEEIDAGKPYVIKADYSDNTTPLLYRFLVWDEGRKTVIAQKYGPDNSYVFVPRKPAAYTITVQVISLENFGYAEVSKGINTTVTLP